jgi:ankyrin repeat protein
MNADDLLLHAAKVGDNDGVNRALEQGATANVLKDDWSALLYASFYGYVAIIQLLMKYRADVNLTDSRGVTPMFVAAQEGCVDAIHVLHEMGGNVSAPNAKGSSPIFAAAQHGHVGAIEALAAFGGNAATPNKSGTTPMFIAARMVTSTQSRHSQHSVAVSMRAINVVRRRL